VTYLRPAVAAAAAAGAAAGGAAGAAAVDRGRLLDALLGVPAAEEAAEGGDVSGGGFVW